MWIGTSDIRPGCARNTGNHNVPYKSTFETEIGGRNMTSSTRMQRAREWSTYTCFTTYLFNTTYLVIPLPHSPELSGNTLWIDCLWTCEQGQTREPMFVAVNDLRFSAIMRAQNIPEELFGQNPEIAEIRKKALRNWQFLPEIRARRCDIFRNKKIHLRK